MNFYPRSPCGERLPEGVKGKAHHSGFLSTLSLRRATLRKFRWVLLVGNFYPRSPCGERLTPARMLSRLSLISIHALLAESDRYSLRHSAQSGYFYPRSPCGERPRIFLDLTFHKNFYPRSPCGERLSGLCKGANMAHFYPRSPCGERRCRPGNCTRCCAFLSTLSLRRATNTNLGRHRGNDDFYPRSPCGERLDMSSAYPAVQCISIHALLAESDQT